MRRARYALGTVFGVIVLAFSLTGIAAAAPGVTLNPTSGNPPSASGNLGGSGWLCNSGSVPGGATVSGTGVGGSATINRDGSLSGSFNVRGSAGDRIEVKVTATTSCPGTVPIYLQASTFFTFNAPPPTATSTPQPTATTAPSATPQPTSTPMPTATSLPTSTPVPTDTSTPQATATTAPSATQQPTSTPVPTAIPLPTFAPLPSATLTSTTSPEPLATPTASIRAQPLSTATQNAPALASPASTGEPRTTATSTTTSIGPRASPTATLPTGGGNGQGSLAFVGCLPSPSQVNVEFLPLGMLASTGSQSTAPSGPAVKVTTAAVQEAPGKLSFQPPGTAEAGRVYQVSVIVDDPTCQFDAKATSQYWLAGAGKDVRLPLVQPGVTRLEVSNNGEKAPTPKPEVKGAFVEFGRPARYSAVIPPSPLDGWETTLDFYGSVESRKQLFRWSTDLTTPVSATLQVGLLPFTTGYEANPFAPAGILASWPVDCVNCEFVVDLSPLPAPAPKKTPATSEQASDSWLGNLGQLVLNAFKAIASLFGDLVNAVVGLFGGSKETADPATLKSALKTVEIPPSKVTVASPNLAGYALANPVPPTFTTFYFRVLPMKDGNPAAGGSNAVTMQWKGDVAPEIKFVIPTPTPTQGPSPYEVQIVSYHGVIEPLDYCTQGEGYYSYVVTQDTWWDKSKTGFYFTTEPIPGSAPWYKKGDVLCEPAPEEPSVWEKIGDWVSGAWNWVAEAYSDLKAFAVDVILDFTPLGLQCQVIAAQVKDTAICEKVFAAGLDAALMTMGIPPDLPNLDQLMGEGLDYVSGYMAEQALAQVGVPPDLTTGLTGVALEEAKQKFKDELQANIKQGLQEGVKQIQLSYADSVGWLPHGVPVRPNDYQPAGMSIRVTRKYGVPGGEAGCTANVSDTLTFAQAKLDNPPPGYSSGFKELNDKHAFHAGQNYDLFVDLSLPVPPLAPGKSVTIPMSFKPNVYNSGWSPTGSVQTTDYFKAWWFMEMWGDVHLSVYGCGSVKLDIAASGTYGPQQ